MLRLLIHAGGVPNPNLNCVFGNDSHQQVVNLEFDLINLRNELESTGAGAARDKIEQVCVYACMRRD